MIRAAVFDLNGTLVDDIAFHYEAWKALSDRLGATMNEAIFQSYNGLKNEDIFPRLLGRPVDDATLAALAAEKEEHYRALFRPVLAPVRGADAFVRRLRARGIPLGLASSAPDGNRTMVLDGLGWNDVFDAIVIPTNLPSKPAPDIYLEAARRLGAPASACIAFEDAENGVRAAAAAGMIVAGLTTNVAAEPLREAGATYTFDDFTVVPDALLALLPG